MQGCLVLILPRKADEAEKQRSLFPPVAHGVGEGPCEPSTAVSSAALLPPEPGRLSSGTTGIPTTISSCCDV